MTEMEIPEDILETAFALTAGGWDQPHPARASKVARAILAERDRCAGIAEGIGRDASRDRETFIMAGMAGLARSIAAAIRKP